jgi:ABC-type amino acid transport substrate-binding protein
MLIYPSPRELFGLPGRVLLLIGLLHLHVTAGGALSARDLDSIISAQSIRVGVKAGETPPFLVGATGSPIGGLEGDFITEVARRMGVKIEWVRTAGTSQELINQVVRSEVDVAIGQMTDSLEWTKSVRFTKPYVLLQEVRLVDRLASNRARGTPKLLEDQTIRVSAVAGSVVLPAIQEEFGSRLAIVPELSTAVDDVLKGRSAAVVGDDVSIIRWLSANPSMGLRLELSTRHERRPGLAMAVSWRSDDLQAWLNLCIDKCVLDGTLDVLIARHLGEDRIRGQAGAPLNR